MNTSVFCDGTRASEVENDPDTSTENNTGYSDSLDECSKERQNIHKKDLKLSSVGKCSFMLLFKNLSLPNTKTVGGVLPRSGQTHLRGKCKCSSCGDEEPLALRSSAW